MEKNRFCPRCGANNSQNANFCVGCGVQLTLAAEPAIKYSTSSPRFAGFWLQTFAYIIDTGRCCLNQF
ncbi:MAG: zinc-ribbon domain-containing protein [Thiotrichaceae bacterium]